MISVPAQCHDACVSLSVLQLCRGVLGPVLSLIQGSDDPSELSSAVTLLMQLLRTCPTAEIVSCNTGAPNSLDDNSTAVLSHILTAARQLLAPSQPDSCSRDAGPLLVQLLKTFPAQLAAAPPAAVAAAGGSPAGASSCVGLLLHDVVVKMGTGACSPATLLSLLEFVVKLALMDVQQLVELLANMQVQRQGGCTPPPGTILNWCCSYEVKFAAHQQGTTRCFNRQCS